MCAPQGSADAQQKVLVSVEGCWCRSRTSRSWARRVLGAAAPGEGHIRATCSSSTCRIRSMSRTTCSSWPSKAARTRPTKCTKRPGRCRAALMTPICRGSSCPTTSNRRRAGRGGARLAVPSNGRMRRNWRNRVQPSLLSMYPIYFLWIRCQRVEKGRMKRGSLQSLLQSSQLLTGKGEGRGPAASAVWDAETASASGADPISARGISSERSISSRRATGCCGHAAITSQHSLSCFARTAAASPGRARRHTSYSAGGRCSLQLLSPGSKPGPLGGCSATSCNWLHMHTAVDKC